MAMVPYSNPAGNNQTSPKSTLAPPTVASLPSVNPTNPATSLQANPLIPTGAGSPGAIAPASVIPGATANAGVPAFTPGTDNAINPTTYNQLTDIYGGVGQQLGAFEGSIAGTNSAALQEYITSLQPQEAQADANLHASLGAGGVSANSSVAALGESNLQAQEFASISGESASLTESQQQLEAKLIESTMPDAAKQVVDSNPLNIAGQVIGDIGSIASDFMGLGGITGGFKLPSFGGASASVPSSGGSDLAGGF